MANDKSNPGKDGKTAQGKRPYATLDLKATEIKTEPKPAEKTPGPAPAAAYATANTGSGAAGDGAKVKADAAAASASSAQASASAAQKIRVPAMRRLQPGRAHLRHRQRLRRNHRVVSSVIWLRASSAAF